MSNKTLGKTVVCTQSTYKYTPFTIRLKPAIYIFCTAFSPDDILDILSSTEEHNIKGYLIQLQHDGSITIHWPNREGFDVVPIKLVQKLKKWANAARRKRN